MKKKSPEPPVDIVRRIKKDYGIIEHSSYSETEDESDSKPSPLVTQHVKEQMKELKHAFEMVDTDKDGEITI